MNFSAYPTELPFTEDYLKEGIPADVLGRYLDSLMVHIGAVQEAAIKLGVPLEQYAVHDLSKFSKEEFGGYAMHFQGGGAPDAFASAWLHHIHFNPHHWNYWIFPDGYTPHGSKVEAGVVFMPDKYTLEMVADWMGASYAYTRSWDMSDWLKKNMRKIILHSDTAFYVRIILTDLGYGKIVLAERFKHELKAEVTDA